MIRLRNQRGEIIPVPDGCFVEFTDADGNIAEVTFQGPNYELRRIDSVKTPSTAENYGRLFGVKFIGRHIEI